MSRRNIELLLLIAAAPVVLLLFALVDGAARSALTWQDFAVPGALMLAFLLAHVAVRFTAPGADPVLLPVVAVLSGVGLAFITRLDPHLAGQQVLWLFIGVGFLIATLAVVPSLDRLARYKYTLMLAGIFLLVLPAVVGREVNGAKLWLKLGPVSFQPSEIAKILIVLFLAAYLAEKREVLSVSTHRVAGLWLPPMRQLGPMLAMWLVSLFVLVAEKDLGSSLLFFGIFLVMVYVATGRPAYTIVGAVLFLVGATAAYFLFAHVRLRVGIWMHPFADATGKGYQLVQSLFAFAAGGMAGTGIGRGLEQRIPFVTTDFIFSAIGEELGLMGGVAIIIAYLVFVLRGLATAVRARSDMAAFTAAGLVAAFGLQAFVIIGGVTRLIPLTGVTLPFVAYGGSSVVANFMLLALLMRAGDEAPTAEGAELLTSGKTGVLGRLALSGRLRWIANAMALLLVALVVNLTYIQVVDAAALGSNPFNTRGLAQQLQQQRGSILTRDGVVLAKSVPDKAVFRRVYPAGELAAHVVGYYSARYGRSGIEAAADQTLAGKQQFRTPQDVINAAAGIPVRGNDVVLTIDSRVQKAAQDALGTRRGACVVLDPRTGAVLAMASNPTFDPGTVDAKWQQFVSAGTAAPLVDRATASLYPPGSTFKVVTLTGALSNNIATPDSQFPGPGTLDIGGGKVTNFESGDFGSISLRDATYQSVNTVYAQVAAKLGPRALVLQADAFGFDAAPPFELPTRTSIMTDPNRMTTWETAWAGVGQPVSTRPNPKIGPSSTPLEMALVAAGIADGGSVPRPYVIDHLADASGTVLSQTSPRGWKQATSPATASVVKDLMIGVVEKGSGHRAQIPGVTVAGKTGTAEASKSQNTHAWFISFAPAEQPKVAMAIVLENAGVGGVEAAPAAKGVLEAALGVVK
jgi:cell division protein FtsW (lipid II flippase)/cell division protein FtsI/penicillin-binding protein 2